MKTKICTKCHIEKPLSEFHKSKQRKDGYKGECKQCRSQKSNKNIERENLAKQHKKLCPRCNQIKDFSEFHKEKTRYYGIGVYCKKCLYNIAKENKHRINKYSKKWYKNNIEKSKQFKQNWNKKNPNYHKRYYQEHKKELSRQYTIYSRNRRRKDVKFRMLLNLRRRIIYAIKGKDKSQKTMDLIGCSIDFLKNHLESKFKEGMTWDNYGKSGWHIDHIKPCALFDLSEPEEQAKCFNYSNLQPLWAEENMNKKDKYPNN
jgi:hypothetical protein